MFDQKPSFLIQLQQRHVFRVAAMYAVTSWLLLQLGSVTFDPLGFPGWSQRALIILIIVGFPIALVLAWIFDVTPQGVVRTDPRPTTGLSRARKLDIVIIVVLLAALLVTFIWRREPMPTPTAAQDSSIAVLPFVAMSEDASLRHLGEGLAEQITNELAGRSELRVASRTSAFEQAGKNAVAIAKGLGVSYVLEGSVRPSGEKVRLTAQLVRGEDGVHIWSDTFDVAEADPAGWDQTASLVAVSTNSYMALERDLEHARGSTTNAEAYAHYAAARRMGWERDSGGTAMPRPSELMLGELDRAIALDPDFVLAHLSRGWLFFNKLDYGGACGARCIDEARRSADRALALRPDDPDALQLLGHLQLINELDPAAAQVTFEQVRQLDPAYPFINESFAMLASIRGNLQDARDYAARQVEITPYFASEHLRYGLLMLGIGDLDGAEREIKSALRLAKRGEVWGIAGVHIQILIQRGQIDQAKAEFEPLWAQFQYSHPEIFAGELAALGYAREARELTAKLSQDPHINPFDVFRAYYALGSYDDALVWLRRSLDDRFLPAIWALRLPNHFPRLRERPRYAALQEYFDSIQRSR